MISTLIALKGFELASIIEEMIGEFLLVNVAVMVLFPFLVVVRFAIELI